MAAGQKKVIVRTFSGEPMHGYLPGSHFAGTGEISLLDPGGRIFPIRMNEIRWIAYVRDFNLQDATDPERLGKRVFPARPRADGLWMKLTFRDGEALEGLAAADVSLLEGLVEEGGLFLTPPDTRSNTQRVFVPRLAVTGLEVLGVIRPAVPKKPQPKAGAAGQPGLFED